MSEPPAVFDPSLQPERTLLAWRRTCLSFVLASLLAMRFTVDLFGTLAVFAGLIGAGLATTAYFAAAVGYSRANKSLHRTGNLAHSAWPLALATGAALMLGAVCAVYVALSVMSAEVSVLSK